MGYLEIGSSHRTNHDEAHPLTVSGPGRRLPDDIGEGIEDCVCKLHIPTD